MDELINRIALRNALYDADAVTMEGVKIINQFPAVDAVEVVRCKACRHGKRGADNIVQCNHPSGKRITMTAYGFCNYGQRREDG